MARFGMSISGRFWVSTEASSIVCLDSTREDRWRVFVDLPAKSESLPLELLALAIDDREYEFQDVMAAVGERIGGERRGAPSEHGPDHDPHQVPSTACESDQSAFSLCASTRPREKAD